MIFVSEKPRIFALTLLYKAGSFCALVLPCAEAPCGAIAVPKHSAEKRVTALLAKDWSARLRGSEDIRSEVRTLEGLLPTSVGVLINTAVYAM